jgi:hypothetical protein
MFGDKLTTANAKINALLAVLASTGFALASAEITDAKTEASALPTADAFKAHLAARETTAITAATAPLTKQVNDLTAASATATAEASAFRAAFTAAGIKLADFVTPATAEGKTDAEKSAAAAATNAASLKLALETAIAQRSSKQIAAAGHPHALDVPPAGPSAEQSDAAPTTKAEFAAGLAARDGKPAERQAYFRRYTSKFHVA